MEVRFLPEDVKSVYILYGGEHYPLRLLDRTANRKDEAEKNGADQLGKGDIKRCSLPGREGGKPMHCGVL